MKLSPLTLSLLAAVSFGLLGCVTSDDATTTNAESGTDSSNSNTNTMSDTNTMSASNTMTSSATDSTTDATTDMTMTTTVDTSGSEESSTTVDPALFEFLPNPPEDYVQVDRKGFPAVNTGLNILGDKNDYNTGDPIGDAAGDFVPNILDSLDALHTGLDDDLTGLSLTPCIRPNLANDDCDEQGVPFVIPDTLAITVTDPAGFPNGRALRDPVIDVILAVLLLNLVDEPNAPVQPVESILTFVELPLNPPANDVDVSDAFPFLAAPN